MAVLQATTCEFGFFQHNRSLEIEFQTGPIKHLLLRDRHDTWTLNYADKAHILDPESDLVLYTLSSVGGEPIIIPGEVRKIRVEGNDPRSPLTLDIIAA